MSLIDEFYAFHSPKFEAKTIKRFQLIPGICPEPDRSKFLEIAQPLFQHHTGLELEKHFGVIVRILERNQSDTKVRVRKRAITGEDVIADTFIRNSTCSYDEISQHQFLECLAIIKGTRFPILHSLTGEEWQVGHGLANEDMIIDYGATAINEYQLAEVFYSLKNPGSKNISEIKIEIEVLKRQIEMKNELLELISEMTNMQRNKLENHAMTQKGDPTFIEKLAAKFNYTVNYKKFEEIRERINRS